MAFVHGICCLGNMVSSSKYSVYLSALDTPRCNMSYIGLFSFLASLEEGTIEVNTANAHRIEKPQGKRAETLPFCAN